MQKRELFWRHVDPEEARTCDVSLWPAEARHNAGPDRVAAIDEDDGNRRGRGLGRQRRRIRVGHERYHPSRDEFGRQRRQPVISLLCPTAFDDKFLPSA